MHGHLQSFLQKKSLTNVFIILQVNIVLIMGLKKFLMGLT